MSITVDDFKTLYSAQRQVKKSTDEFFRAYKQFAREFNKRFITRLVEEGVVTWSLNDVGYMDYEYLYRDLGKFDSLYARSNPSIRQLLLQDVEDVRVSGNGINMTLDVGSYYDEDFSTAHSIPMEHFLNMEPWVEQVVQMVLKFVKEAAVERARASSPEAKSKRATALFNRNYHLARKAVEAKGGTLTEEQFVAMQEVLAG